MTIRVLLCDDTEDIRRLLRLSLTMDPDIEIVGEAADGAEGVALAAQLQPDVVLLDLAMPVMDGLAALPQIRVVSPETRIAILSGFDEKRLAEQALRLGALRYLEKGVALNTISETVKELGGMSASEGHTPAEPDGRSLGGASA
jgi:YesN/AraC family two-component response regulator